MDRDTELRAQLSRLLAWRDAHVDLDEAVRGLPAPLRGATPPGMPHSPWQLLEHLRLTQRDILDFCVKSDYTEPHWPDDYWPESAAPPSDDAWDRSIAAYKDDLAALQRLAADTSIDLFAKIPHGTGQTYLRELLLTADHTAYHVGQIVDARRALGAWGAG
ncbi:MAG TPA: DinB family protein [Gemmatimonadaceae bacterium]